MRKLIIGITAALIAVHAMAIDLGSGFDIGGGVKTGILIRNSDYAGKLDGLAHGSKYPMTLFFASQDSDSYKGEGWLAMGYSAETWGLRLSFWAHGDLKQYNDLVHLGDHFLWANFLEERLCFIGGQGGGTPISTGGWLDADWLSYTGLRMFWIDPMGFSIGINFPDPDNGWQAEGIKPVTYLSMIMFGAGYRNENFWVSVVFDNNPIYDDSKANYDGGLHRGDADPIAQSGNIGFGLGFNNIFGGKGVLAFDGMVTNLGEDDVMARGTTYKLSPVKTTLALKAGYPIIDTAYTEIKAKYTISQGDNSDDSASTSWGKFEFEPYISYQVMKNLRFDVTLNYTGYVNSYYMALDYTPLAVFQKLNAGQVGDYSWAYDYLSAWQMTIKPAVAYSFGGASMILGYNGEFSRDFAQNTLFIDFRWSF